MIVTYNNDKFTFIYGYLSYSAKVHTEANYSYTPGRRYMPNGDPGYPDEEDFEITKLDVADIKCEDDEDLVITDKLREALINKISDVLTDMDISYWDFHDDRDYDED